jgi:hypothetical protein
VVGFCFGWHRVPAILLRVSTHILVVVVLAESFTVTYCQLVVCGVVVVGDLVVPYCSSGGGVNFLWPPVSMCCLLLLPIDVLLFVPDCRGVLSALR